MQIDDTVKGKLVFQNLTDEICDPLNGPLDLLKLVARYLGVSIPRNITNVIIGNETPGQDQTNYLWVRRESNGIISGLYVFCAGKWTPLYAFAPRQVIRVFNSDSRTIPDGFILFSDSDASEDEKNAQMATWVRNSTDLYYTLFDIVYIGCQG